MQAPPPATSRTQMTHVFEGHLMEGFILKAHPEVNRGKQGLRAAQTLGIAPPASASSAQVRSRFITCTHSVVQESAYVQGDEPGLPVDITEYSTNAAGVFETVRPHLWLLCCHKLTTLLITSCGDDMRTPPPSPTFSWKVSSYHAGADCRHV